MSVSFSLPEAARMVSFGMVVLIWLVQMVIYPAFAEVTPGRFVAHHAGYTRMISYFVIPLMFSQAGLIVALLLREPGRAVGLAAALVVVAWISTFALSVPAHQRLGSGGLDAAVVRTLVATNWVRTAAWTGAWLALFGVRG